MEQQSHRQGYDDRYYLSVCLYTFGSLVEHPDWVIEFVEATFVFANPFQKHFNLAVSKLPRGKEVRRKFSQSTWQWCQEELRKGTLQWLGTYRGPRASDDHFGIYWTTHIWRENERSSKKKYSEGQSIPWWEFPIPSNLTFAIELPLRTETVDLQLQEKVVELARTIFRKIDGVYGYINLSRRAPSADAGGTEYERKHGVLATDTMYFLDHKIRGIFWENYLTDRHIEKLGGVESVRASAPCARVEEIIPDRNALALRLTEDINEPDPVRAEKLERYLEPLALIQK